MVDLCLRMNWTKATYRRQPANFLRHLRALVTAHDKVVKYLKLKNG